jgi:protein-tyrosine phosphatase
VTIDADAPTRLISLEGAFNFRDLGGYPIDFGGRVRWRRMFRSDNLCTLTEGDYRVLAALPITTVIDLRTPGELERSGRIDKSPSYSYHHFPMADVLPDTKDARWSSEEYVAARYGQMLAGADDCLRGVISLAADPKSYPLVFHCAAGKDRTGMVASIILDLLGVDREEIIADYMLTRPAMDRMVAYWTQTSPERAKLIEEHLPAIKATRPGNISGLLALLDERYGSALGYTQHIGVADKVPALRVNLLSQR